MSSSDCLADVAPSDRHPARDCVLAADAHKHWSTPPIACGTLSGRYHSSDAAHSCSVPVPRCSSCSTCPILAEFCLTPTSAPLVHFPATGSRLLCRAALRWRRDLAAPSSTALSYSMSWHGCRQAVGVHPCGDFCRCETAAAAARLGGATASACLVLALHNEWQKDLVYARHTPRNGQAECRPLRVAVV